MQLTLLSEMAAKKICPDCGKSMAGFHYWYKGAWKCKKSSTEPSDTVTPVTPPQAQPAAAEPTTPTQELKSVIAKQAVQANVEKSADAHPQIVEQPLEVTIDIISEAKPLLDAELVKINKTAAKIGADVVTTTVLKTYFKEMERRDPNDPGRVEKYRVKMLTINLKGSTPRIKSADGTFWNFIGVITPSASGKAILKLTPSAEDSEGVRKMYSTNPYYCDHCRTTRTRNETFIVQNGTNYRQVGRNCLKDFVGGTNPQALLNFFSWFADAEQLEAHLAAKFAPSGEGGGGGYGSQYYEPKEVLSAAIATVQYRKGYVSAKAEYGRSTASDVRTLLWGRLNAYSTDQEKADFKAMQTIRGEEAVQKKAADIIEWFKAVPQKEKDANTFFKNIEVMVDDDAVESKQIGYIVGLFPAYQRAMQQSSEAKSGVKLVKEWPDAWGMDPRPVTDQHATVKFVKELPGQYGSSQLINVMMDDGIGASWRYSGSLGVEVDDEYTLTGTFERDSYFDPARIKFVPDRRWLRGPFRQQVEANEKKEKG